MKWKRIDEMPIKYAENEVAMLFSDGVSIVVGRMTEAMNDKIDIARRAAEEVSCYSVFNAYFVDAQYGPVDWRPVFYMELPPLPCSSIDD